MESELQLQELKENITVAVYQQDIVWNDPDANFDKVGESLAAIDESVDIIVLPETFSCGFGDNMVNMAEPDDGPSLCFARKMAKCCDALFVATWPVSQDGRVYNRLHWVFPDGTFGFYNKAHTFRVSGEADIIARGSTREVFEWRGWRIKPAVCYDLRFPKWLRNAQLHDNLLSYDILLVCANWPGSRHEAWSTLLKARAIENLAYVVGVNRVGVDGADIHYTGNSAVVDYKGLPMVECEAGKEQLLMARLDKESLDNFRQHWPFYLDFD